MNNFLSIVWYRVLPPDYGGQKGIAHFNYYLAKKIPLTCLCSKNNHSDDKLPYLVINSLPVSKFRFLDPFVRRKILAFIRKQAFTHIIIEHPWHGWLGKYKKKYDFRLIVHAHNIEYKRLKKKNWISWPFLKRTERNAFARADHILFKTEKDKEMAIDLFAVPPQRCIIVPSGTIRTTQPLANGEKIEAIRKKHSIPPDEKIILFAGSLNYGPNQLAVDTIVRNIIPLLRKKRFSFRMVICGALSQKTETFLNTIPNLTVAGFVDGFDYYLQSADVFINPVTTGSGIQTKNIEAIANGCNVAATTFAASGLPPYLISNKLFVSRDNDWEQFADNIITASAQLIPVPGQFYHDYHWENIVDRLLPGIVCPE